MASQKEVVMIGGGVIGCSIAYHLAKQGIPSQIIERDSIASRASGKAWAVLPYPPGYIAMEDLSPDELFSMSRGSVSPWLEHFWLGYHRLPDIALELKEKGVIDIGFGDIPKISVALSERDERELKKTLSSLRNEGYYEGSWLETDELRGIYPDMGPRARGGLVTPFLQVEPYRYTLGLVQAAEKMGASVKQGEVV